MRRFVQHAQAQAALGGRHDQDDDHAAQGQAEDAQEEGRPPQEEGADAHDDHSRADGPGHDAGGPGYDAGGAEHHPGGADHYQLAASGYHAVEPAAAVAHDDAVLSPADDDHYEHPAHA